VGVRYWLPGLAAVVCLIGSTRTTGVVAYVLIIAGIGLICDVSTKLYETAGRGGRLTDHRQ
jgi:hypothetical protein